MNDTRDRLYQLLPAIYRLRDAERGYPLRDLLRVVSEQVDVVEEDITQLYDNWFIETAQDWVVPYIAELVGYTPVNAAGDPKASAADENRILIPRREVANTIGYRRRRGTLSVLEELAAAVARWPARAIEYFRLLAWTQNLNHPHSEGQRARLTSLRSVNELDKLGTPFDPFARTVDLRRISSQRGQGRYNIPSVGVWIWRLGAHPVTRAPAYCLDAGKNSYTFSVLGNDAPLFTHPEPEASSTHIADELNVPTPIRRRAFDADKERYYGEGKSLVIWADWAGHRMTEPLPPQVIIPADLTDWQYTPPDGFVAVDPQLGRIQFPPISCPAGTSASATPMASVRTWAAANMRASSRNTRARRCSRSARARPSRGSETHWRRGVRRSRGTRSSRSPTAGPTWSPFSSHSSPSNRCSCAPRTGSARCSGCSTGRPMVRTP